MAPDSPKSLNLHGERRLDSAEIGVKTERLSGNGDESNQGIKAVHVPQVAGGSGTKAVVGCHESGFLQRMNV